MKCPACGQWNRASMPHCQSCGAPLNIDEAEKYFSSVDDRKAFTTDYAHKKNADDSDRSAGWWLRSPGGGSNYAASVRSDGDFALYGYSVDDGNVAVRPSFWLKL